MEIQYFYLYHIPILMFTIIALHCSLKQYNRTHQLYKNLLKSPTSELEKMESDIGYIWLHFLKLRRNNRKMKVSCTSNIIYDDMS